MQRELAVFWCAAHELRSRVLSMHIHTSHTNTRIQGHGRGGRKGRSKGGGSSGSGVGRSNCKATRGEIDGGSQGFHVPWSAFPFRVSVLASLRFSEHLIIQVGSRGGR